jgi:hypothetical protein
MSEHSRRHRIDRLFFLAAEQGISLRSQYKRLSGFDNEQTLVATKAHKAQIRIKHFCAFLRLRYGGELMEASLTHEEFSKNANTKFQVQADENSHVELDLIAVSELKLHPRQEEFSLRFRGPLDTFLGQGVRDFTHDQMGRFELFIVPIKKDEQGFYYEAVFNRLRKSDE